MSWGGQHKHIDKTGDGKDRKRQRTSEMQVITKSKQEPKLNNIIKPEQ